MMYESCEIIFLQGKMQLSSETLINFFAIPESYVFAQLFSKVFNNFNNNNNEMRKTLLYI